MESSFTLTDQTSGTETLKHDDTWKRFQAAAASLPPVVTLDAEGNIVRLSAAARRLLEYRPEDALQPCFFSHVHAKNQYQVMRDIADMICHGKRHANWLLRLRTSRGRWRWFKADVRSGLDKRPAAVTIHLSELRDW